MKESNYEPYGKEWEKELFRIKKNHLFYMFDIPPTTESKKDLIERIKRILVWRDLWVSCYEQLYKTKRKPYQSRLQELLEWDTPINSKETDKDGKWDEWFGKVKALKMLIDKNSTQ